MPKITFVDSLGEARDVEAEVGSTVMEAAIRHAILSRDDLPLFQPSKHTGLTTEIAHGVARYLAGETDATMRASKVKRIAENVGALFHRNKS